MKNEQKKQPKILKGTKKGQAPAPCIPLYGR
jgi:hypothetical protein